MLYAVLDLRKGYGFIIPVCFLYRLSRFVYLFCALHTFHYASFTRDCHGTAALQAQTTSIYDVMGHSSILFSPQVWTQSV